MSSTRAYIAAFAAQSIHAMGQKSRVGTRARISELLRLIIPKLRDNEKLRQAPRFGADGLSKTDLPARRLRIHRFLFSKRASLPMSGDVPRPGQ